jgi:pimeloyl-ACP methyl ester carboxylesterase
LSAPTLVVSLSKRGWRLEKAGAGDPALVFVHGFCCSSSDWRYQVEEFAATSRVLAVDLPAHGGSPSLSRCTVQALIDETIGLIEDEVSGPCVVIGHSMGCRMALGAGAALSEQVVGLVFVDGSWVGNGDAEELAAAALARLDAEGLRATLRRSFEDMFLDDSNPVFRDQALDRALAVPSSTVRTLLPDIFRWDATNLGAVLTAVEQPVLALQSTQVNEQAVRVPITSADPVPWLELLCERIRNLRTEFIERAGHFSMLERPMEVNAAIYRFLDSLCR